ncbi:hypothetical protein [Streptomyces sp. NBC_01500]|uniref:hypothetical protein n=1 Tax=Streptomyces sp. NBC_01500 TaxID=2903886 RepID=UPI002259B436|nr:hypothetical protein [Streptomyces sp. NBC_01500]MCX4554221.1 hypothetical protein [Streptomyces sp. NBC_01500]
MSSYGAGIQRGAMAADHFVQIANGLFRDRRISFKAKGIFGLIASHRNGWRVSVRELVRSSTEGVHAVRAGLTELECFGYLTRIRERAANGTWGDIVYAITDMPAATSDLTGQPATGGTETRRSQPGCDFPLADNPTADDPPTKNTRGKKTSSKNPIRPSVPGEAAEHGSAPSETGPAPAPSGGVSFLLHVAAQHPEYLLTGKALQDQGKVITSMLEEGWAPDQLEHVIVGRPLPEPVYTSIGAIVAARLRSAGQAPPPRSLDFSEEGPGAQPAQNQDVDTAVAYRPLVECSGCGRPGTAPGEDLCPACLQWPLCTSCTGPTPRYAHPAGDGRCTNCRGGW